MLLQGTEIDKLFLQGPFLLAMNDFMIDSTCVQLQWRHTVPRQSSGFGSSLLAE